VVGRVSECADGWCLFDVGGRRGYIRVDTLWGVEPTESIG
jgi:SH3-like domain-containing protein